MSFDLWARPAPRDVPEPTSFYDAKWVIAELIGNGLDGSCRTGKAVVGAEAIPYLVGARAGRGRDSDSYKSFTELIDLIRDNPQGVEMWIGDHNDF
jgi:hypothetical protein